MWVCITHRSAWYTAKYVFYSDSDFLLSENILLEDLCSQIHLAVKHKGPTRQNSRKAYQVVPKKRPDGCHITRATRTVWPSISATGSSLKRNQIHGNKLFCTHVNKYSLTLLTAAHRCTNSVQFERPNNT